MSLSKITEKKQEFSIEKIASAIHAEYLISSLKNKYIDPLILYRRKISKNKEKKQREDSEPDPDSFSRNKILVHQYLKPKNNENKLNLNIKNNILPIISPKNLNNNKTDKYLMTSGMFKQKEFYKQNYQKLKLGNVMNYKTNNESVYKNLYPKIESIRRFSEKYNLNLNLKFYSEEKPIIKFIRRKSVAHKDIMNYLFNKYIIQPKNNNKSNNNNEEFENSKNNENDSRLNINNKLKFKGLENKKKRFMTIDEILENNNIYKLLSNEENKDSKKAFITRIKIKKAKKEETEENIQSKSIKLKNRKRLFPYYFEKNKNIIKHDQKIFVDCLYSEINSNLDKNKIIYDPIGNAKTNFAITKEPSYKTIKKFETTIDNIIKMSQDLTISINK